MHQEGWISGIYGGSKKKKGSGRRMSLYHPTYVKLKNSTTISGNMSYKWKLWGIGGNVNRQFMPEVPGCWGWDEKGKGTCSQPHSAS